METRDYYTLHYLYNLTKSFYENLLPFIYCRNFNCFCLF